MGFIAVWLSGDVALRDQDVHGAHNYVDFQPEHSSDIGLPCFIQGKAAHRKLLDGWQCTMSHGHGFYSEAEYRQSHLAIIDQADTLSELVLARDQFRRH